LRGGKKKIFPRLGALWERLKSRRKPFRKVAEKRGRHRQESGQPVKVSTRKNLEKKGFIRGKRKGPSVKAGGITRF